MISTQYDNNESSEKKGNIRKTGDEEINELIWEWSKDVTSRGLPVIGPLIQVGIC